MEPTLNEQLQQAGINVWSLKKVTSLALIKSTLLTS